MKPREHTLAVKVEYLLRPDGMVPQMATSRGMHNGREIDQDQYHDGPPSARGNGSTACHHHEGADGWIPPVRYFKVEGKSIFADATRRQKRSQGPFL